jgi:uncharacterized protein (TIGR02246 family)
MGLAAAAAIASMPLAAAHAAPPGPDAGAALVRSALPAMEAADKDWIGAMKAGDAERLAEPYAPDAVFVMPDGKVYTGRPAILALFKARAAARATILSGEIVREGTAYGGSGLVYEWGHGGLTRLDAAGRKTTSGGPYLTVWRRDGQGRWKITRNLVF